MRSRTRWWPVLLVVLALVAAACGDDADDTTTSTSAPPTTTAADTTTTQPSPTTTTSGATTTTSPETTTATTSAPVEGGSVIIGTTFGWDSLDPADATDFGGYELLVNYNEALLVQTPGSTDLAPGIAEGLPEISDDGLTYTLRLRDGVMFGDGLELTAPMYVEQFQRARTLEGDTSSNVTPYIADIEATDDRTIVFTLTDNFAFFPNLLALPPYGPAHPDIFPGDEIVRLPEAPIYGVGPWMISEFVAGEQVVLEPNPFYHGDPPSVERVILQQFEDPQTMALALQSGEIDVAFRGLEAEQVTQLESADDITVAAVPGGLLLYFVVNSTFGPTDDANVRQAIAAVVDRDEIVDRVYGGFVEPLYSQVQPGILGANEAFDDRYGSPDIELAESLLADSGYSAENPVKIVLGFPGARYGEASVDAQSVIKEQLEATGLFEVELQSAEASTYFDALFGGETYNLGFLGFGFDFPDPDNHLGLFVFDGGLGTNVTTADNEPNSDEAAALMDLLQRGATTTDVGERVDIYEEAQDLWAEMVVTLPLYRRSPFVAYRDGVVGDGSLPNADALNIGALQTQFFRTLSLAS